LAQGINPCEMKATLGKNAFVLRMAEWQIAQNPPAATTPPTRNDGCLHVAGASEQGREWGSLSSEPAQLNERNQLFRL
jgi:hypothetical protein